MNERVNILLVDDQPAKLLSYEVILNELGENLIKAHSGREALECLLKYDVAVVLMDVSMPELDGFELAEIIRQHPRYQRTAIIFVSAVHLTDLDRLRGYQHGAVDYVSVPVVPEILRAKVSVFADLYRKTRQLERLNRELEQRVTERAAELEASTARLRESEARLDAILQNTNVAIYLMSPDNYFIHINRCFEERFNLKNEAVRGKNIHEVFPPEIATVFETNNQRVIGEHAASEFEEVVPHADGLHIYTSIKTPLFDEAGQPRGIVSVSTDITERKRAEEDQQLLAQMRERNRLAQELHDNVAQALGYLNLKMGQTHDFLTTSRLNEVGANLRELRQIVNETYADIRAEIFNLRAAPAQNVRFLETLRQYLDKYQRFYRLDIDLVFEADETYFDFPSEVSIALIRTIQEALMNVRKHARVDRALIRLGQRADGWQINIEDGGRGFVLNGLGSKDSTSYGLKIMQERIEGVGGHLEIVSAPGQGTRINLFYPRQ